VFWVCRNLPWRADPIDALGPQPVNPAPGTFRGMTGDERTLDGLVALLLRVGLIEDDDAAPFREVLRQTLDITGGTIHEHHLVGFAQAFGRGVERIALAGADAAARSLADVPEDEREERLRAWLAGVTGPAADAFAIVFARRLDHLARRRLAAASGDDISSSLHVAFVDLCGSTEFMLRSAPHDVEALADELFAVGHELGRRHDVAAGKFLGDGVMFLSADPARLLGAACDAVRLLTERTPLSAGGGVSRGDVVRRGGDWFGTPVNLAARLAEVAPAGEILLDHDALPAGTVPVEWREILPRGLSEPRRVGMIRP
jgi:class 3 adenylate cyclase